MFIMAFHMFFLAQESHYKESQELYRLRAEEAKLFNWLAGAVSLGDLLRFNTWMFRN